MSRALLGLCLSIVLVAGAIVVLDGMGHAGEPYREFIDKLRDERLYDLALDYLDDLQKNKLADDAFTVEIPLERARLYQESAAGMGLRSPQRATRLDDAERAFNSFLDVNKNHPRRSEARLGLGNLLLARAEEARQQGETGTAKPEAVKFYGQAQQLFEASLKELGDILTQMKGARIDANDEAKKQQRDKYRDDYRRAELLLAFATENRGRSQAQGSPEWKADLEKAQGLYTELYMHEKERIEARNYALFYRSGIQRDFGKIDDAVDGYSRIVSEGIDELRPLQFKAVTEMIKLWCSKTQNKYPAGLELAAKWERQLRPDERNTQDAIDLLLAAAAAKVEYAEVLQAKDPDDRSIGKLRREARDSLQKLSRINGSHQQTARQWMAKLGVSKEKTQEPLELPKVKNFAEATKEATDRIDQMRDEAVAQQSLLESLDKASDAQQKKELGDQLAVVNGNLDRIRDQAAELLRMGLRMFPPGGEAEELNDARYRLAFVELQRGNPWEAIAIGEFLAQANAGSDNGLQCATVALAGFGKLITEADAELQKTIVDQLQPFAEFMVKTWPNSSEAQAAASTLVQLAMSAGDFAKAQSYLDKLPSGTGKADKLRRDIGLVLASQYFQDKAKLAEGTEASAELNAKRDAALQQLTLALKDLKKEELDSRTIEAINSLVRLQLATGKLTEATQWMTNRDLSPVSAIAANPELVTERLVKLDSYRTALQATISRLGDGQGSSDLLKQIEQLIADLQKSAGDDSEGKKLLTSIFIKVARDLQDLVQNADSTEKKQKLADGLVLLAQQIANSSPDFSTKMWAGQTLNKVAAVLDDSAKNTRVKLYKESVSILQSILDKEAKSPGWISTPNGDILVKITLAKNLRQSGDFQAAVDLLAQVLTKNASMLDVQMEAAEILQAWGDSGQAEKYDLAINGTGSDGKGGRAIWGWAKLAKSLDRKTDFANQFFQCRYQLAVCLMRSGLAQSDAQKKAAALGRAEREIGATVLLYPTLGGEANKKRFDTLLKSIQQALNKEPVGIAKDSVKAK